MFSFYVNCTLAQNNWGYIPLIITVGIVFITTVSSAITRQLPSCVTPPNKNDITSEQIRPVINLTSWYWSMKSRSSQHVHAKIRVTQTALTYSSMALQPIYINETCVISELTAGWCLIQSRRRPSTGACTDVLTTYVWAVRPLFQPRLNLIITKTTSSETHAVSPRFQFHDLVNSNHLRPETSVSTLGLYFCNVFSSLIDI